MKPILFFDGVCGLCNGVVNFLLRHDKQHKILFAPLQGSTAQQYLMTPQTLRSLVLYENGRAIEQAEAVLRLGMLMGGVWKFLAVAAHLIPFKNVLYRFVARYRYWWFGKRAICRLPSPEERQRFLD
jgi:predicted DCC family thiol-disulfide oxidoreductase YuxK